MIKYGLDSSKVYKNNKGYSFKIVKFTDAKNVDIKFNSGFELTTRADHIKSGRVRDRLSPCLYGVGIHDIDSGSKCKIYARWAKMFERCYSPEWHNSHPTYEKCTVAKEWHLFSNFKKWMENQDYTGKDLDKDILKINNTVYSPRYCRFISKELNRLITNHARLADGLPTGVRFDTKEGKYIAEYRRNRLGGFDKISDANKAYIKAKHDHLMIVASNESGDVAKGLKLHAKHILKRKA